jgi:hypothetical protein
MSGEKNIGPIVVDAKIINVSPRLYRAVQSFLNSSLKTSYIWNVGIHFFEKFGEWSWEDRVVFAKPGKWELRFVEKVEQNPPTEGAKTENYAILEDPRGNYIKDDGVKVEVADVEAHFVIDYYKEPTELRRTYLAPSRQLPFAAPVSLEAVLDKIGVYSEAVDQHLEACIRKEEGKTETRSGAQESAV